MTDMEERVRRAEEAAKENKSALAQLISHTKNVERAVTLSQQDISAKKQQQGTKMLELEHKLASVAQNRETLERTVYNIRDEVRELEHKLASVAQNRETLE